MDYIKINEKQVPTEFLQCSICEASLSSAPILVSSDGSNICSQCNTFSDKGFRNFALELVLSDATFPCIFNKHGCSERPLFGKVIEHQQECRYSPIACASVPFTTCTWKGTINEIREHFSQKHPDLVKENAIFQLEVKKNTNGVLMVVENKFPYLVKYSYETNTQNLHYNVAYFKLDASIEDGCKIKLFNVSNPDYIAGVEAAKCVPYNDDFFLGDSKALVCLEKFLEILNNPLNIRVELILPKYSCQNMSQLMVDYEFLESKKCNKCGNFLMLPIFFYGGNYICSDCSYTHVSCKLNDDEELHNNLAKQNYPCQWHGCEHIVKGDAILGHLNRCKYRIYVCPDNIHYGCKALFKFSEMIEHLKKLQYKYFVHEFTHKWIDGVSNISPGAFTIVENEFIIITYSSVSHRGYIYTYALYTSNVNWRRYTVQLRLQHDHCKRIPKEFSFNRSLSLDDKEFPKCFFLGNGFSVTIKVS